MLQRQPADYGDLSPAGTSPQKKEAHRASLYPATGREAAGTAHLHQHDGEYL